ncbi:MAG: hypothetical protein ACNA7T_07080 [Haliea sp.]
MSNIALYVGTTYGPGDQPIPRFNCPVIIGGKLADLVGFCGNTDHRQIVREAASAAELASRFEDEIEYMRFQAVLSLPRGSEVRMLAVTLVDASPADEVKAAWGDKVIQIDLPQSSMKAASRG